MAGEVRGRRRLVTEVSVSWLAVGEPRGFLAGARQAFRGLRAGWNLDTTVWNGAEVARPGPRECRRAGDRAVSARPRRCAARQPQRIWCPAYLGAPLVDPYTGREVKYRSDGARFKVYGVGIDRRDDGGVVGAAIGSADEPDVDIRRTSASRSAPGRAADADSPLTPRPCFTSTTSPVCISASPGASRYGFRRRRERGAPVSIRCST